MERSRGNITPYRLFSVRDLGLGNPEPPLGRVFKAFLGIGEAVAARWIQMPNAILLLQMAPENPASGAIYLYDRLFQDFYMLSFEGPEDTLALEDFSQLLPEYGLLRFAEQPGLLQVLFPLGCSAVQRSLRKWTTHRLRARRLAPVPKILFGGQSRSIRAVAGGVSSVPTSSQF